MNQQADYAAHYAKWHDGTVEDYERFGRFYSDLLAPVLPKIRRDHKLLDVGCGTGLLVYALKRAGYRDVTGIDISASQIALAVEKGLPCRQVDEHYIHDLASSKPGSVDTVFLMDVLEHLEVSTQLEFLRAVRQVVRPGGRLILSVPNANSTFAMRWRHIDWTHRASFTEHSIEFALISAGFSSVYYHRYEFGGPIRFPFIHKYSNWLLVIRWLFRTIRRIEAIAELGREGFRIPLGLNLLVEAEVR